MKIIPKNRLCDLNDHLFEELERLNDENLKGEELQEEKDRAKAIADIAQRIINNSELAFKAIKYYEETGLKMPKQLELGDKNET